MALALRSAQGICLPARSRKSAVVVRAQQKVREEARSDRGVLYGAGAGQGGTRRREAGVRRSRAVANLLRAEGP